MFHWQAPGYLFLFPVLGDGVARLLPAGSGRNRLVTGWLKTSVIVYPLILAIAASHAATGWLRGPFPGLFTAGDPSLDALDWTDLGLFLSEKGLAGPPIKFVIASNWIDAAKIDYGLKGRLPVLCLSKAPHHFAFMHAPGEFKGQEGLIIVRQKSASKALKAYAPYFAALEPAGTAKIKRRIYGEEDLAVFRGWSFSGTYPLPYGLGVAGRVNWREHNAPD